MSKEMIETLNRLCSYKSIAQRTGSLDFPYGEEVNKALKYMLELCDSFGFKTKNIDNQLGYAEIGEGEEIFGILVHLDVVPVGNGWKYDPFAATLDGDKIFGRGTIDDKGPAVAAVYAMKELLDAGADFSRRIRIIFGQTEENGEWDDMEYYKAHEEIPTLGITPDADYPAIYGEKGILHFYLSMPKNKAGFIFCEGGQAANIVCDEAKAIVEINGKEVEFHTKGRAAHGSVPYDGENAISKLMQEIASETDNCKFANFYNKYIGFDLYGEKMGVGLKDMQSGKLTFNVGRLIMDDDWVKLNVDIRYPVTYTAEQVEKAIKNSIVGEGVEFEITESQSPVYMDKDGDFIKTLVKIYQDETGRTEEAEVIGGGTYARAMNNIVAFGPCIPGQEMTEHQDNEYIYEKDLVLMRTLIKKVLLKTCTKVSS